MTRHGALGRSWWGCAAGVHQRTPRWQSGPFVRWAGVIVHAPPWAMVGLHPMPRIGLRLVSTPFLFSEKECVTVCRDERSVVEAEGPHARPQLGPVPEAQALEGRFCLLQTRPGVVDESPVCLPRAGGGGWESAKIVICKIWRNKSVPNLAQQKCTKLSRGVLRTKATFRGVIFSASGVHSLEEMTASTHSRGLRLFLCHNPGILQ